MKSKQFILSIVGAIIVAGIGFYGGTIYAKSTPSTAGARNGQFVGRAGGAGRGGMMGGFASGKIVSADDKSITIEMAAGPNGVSGGSKIILTSDSTKIYKTTEGAKTDLTKDATVTVTGTANQDGSITAQSIQIRPDGMVMPMMGGFGGRGSGSNTGAGGATQ